MIRILVADDSATARELLVSLFRSDPEFEVVGEARDGLEAVSLTQTLRPDIVAMDLRMPRMDGFLATKEIMITAPTPIVLITSSHRFRETEGVMPALRAGALTVLEKPAGPVAPGFDEACRHILSTFKAMAQVKVVRHWRPAARTLPSRPARRATQPPLVAIATSTGGPAALQVLLAGLPVDFPAPILVVQHITIGFVAGLASWLNTVCDFQVKVAEPGEALAAQHVYLAPDHRHLGVTGQRTVLLSDAPPIGGFRPSGTFLFESVARAAGAAAVALILTGMGEDGVAGLRAIRQAGGRVFAQDQPSSVVHGMPGAAVAAGLVDTVLPLEEIAAQLVQDLYN